jgi:hypothetical protein
MPDEFFTWGSVVWVLNGFFAWQPQWVSEEAAYLIQSITGIVGGTLFECGAYCMMLEASNVGHTLRFGYEVKHLVEENRLLLLPHNNHGTAHPHLPTLMATLGHAHNSATNGHASDGSADSGAKQTTTEASKQVTASESAKQPSETVVSGKQQQMSFKWRWWSWGPWNNLGYLGSIITFISATIYWESTLFNSPHAVAEADASNVWAWDTFFWTTQVIGSMAS